MKRLGIAATLLALLLAACAQQGSGSLGAVSDDETPDQQTPGPTPMPTKKPGKGDGKRTFTYEVWFVGQEGGRLFVVRRTAPFEPAVGRTALTDLLAGPTAAEIDAGLATAIPPSTELRGLVIDDGIASVDLTSAYDAGGGSLEEILRLAQVVYTITQFETVRGVRFLLDGRPVDVFGGHGIMLDRPQTRRNYEDLLPAIVVESPSIGAKVESPVAVSGTANVFEATVSLRILDERGRAIARTFTTATCGTGCRGEYAISVPYEVDREQPGTIEVFEVSAEDGRPINVVRIPVTLTP